MQISLFIGRLRTFLESRKGWAIIAKGAMLIGIGFLAAWLLIPSQNRQAPTKDGSPLSMGRAEHSNQMWTCSMHPQIQRPGPGSCPICGMDLIPVGGSGAGLTGLRQLELSPAATALLNIQVRPVERRFVTADVRMVGKIEYDETRLKRITAWIPGRLDRLYVDYTGVQVNEGDHLVYIYSPELYSAQQELIQTARAARDRGQELPRSPLGRFDLLESSREKLRLMGLTETQVREIEQQDQPLSHLTIYAPIGGIVIEKFKKEGDYVRTGEQIYSVVDLSRVWVQLDAYESDLAWLRYGQEVSFFTEAYPGERFMGRIAFIDPVLDDRTRTVKVRVNVENPEGKLKPSMFVRGIARSQVASGGRVVDAFLAGKWISPMHPEILKDEPGICDVCGMPLVPVESLGYVSSDDLQTEPPLVVPASAVLWTGTRAVVYVELPNTEQPTYEGREIVLGSRTEDDYLVRGGLREGELVVTHGSFRIDSALQIQARPSMMTPEGGGGGGHQHDHGAPSAPTGEPSPTNAAVQLPPDFLIQLKGVEDAFNNLQERIAESDITSIQMAFRRLGATVTEVDAELISGHSAMQWEEYRMLLGNDAIEGQDVDDADTARRIGEKSARTMARVREQFLRPHEEHAGHLDHASARLEVPDSLAAYISELLVGYFALQSVLASDDLEAARRAVADLRSVISRDTVTEMPDATRDAWNKERRSLETIAAELTQQTGLEAFRVSFSVLSGEMEGIVQRFGAGSAGPVYRVHCPMAMDNQGAWWLQQTEEIRNPYFGSTMLKCHDRFEKIASGASGGIEEHNHD